MTIYLDSSALAKLYVIEEDSAAVARFVTRRRKSLPVSLLHELELKNGLRLKAFRREAHRNAIGAALRHLDEDFASGILIRPPLDWPEVFEAAGLLSDRYAATLGCRPLDLLHVASAKILKAQGFLTFDKRQATLARKAGLKLVSCGDRRRNS